METKTHCKHGHFMDRANTYITPRGYTECKTCRRLATKRSLARHPKPKKTPPLRERFESKICYEPMSGCWLWTAGVTKSGYGKFKYRGQTIGAHRVSYMLYKGLIDTEFVLHRCDNPSCVNPDHLFLGTAKDNTQDMLAKGRHGGRNQNSTKPHCKHGHEFTPENTRTYTRNGGERRACRMCERLRMQRTRKRNKEKQNG